MNTNTRWVASYASNVIHAAYADLEPFCGGVPPVAYGEIDDDQWRRIRRRQPYMCRRCQKLTGERPPWLEGVARARAALRKAPK